MNPTKNRHFIEARYHGATNTRGSRIKLTSHRFPNDSLSLNYDDGCGQTHEQAHDKLLALGYTITAEGETRDGFFFAVDQFTPLREMLSIWKKGRAA